MHRHHVGIIAATENAKRPEKLQPLVDHNRCPMIYEQPLVEPQVSHFKQVPLRTMVKLPHSEQLSPS